MIVLHRRQKFMPGRIGHVFRARLRSILAAGVQDALTAAGHIALIAVDRSLADSAPLPIAAPAWAVRSPAAHATRPGVFDRVRRGYSPGENLALGSMYELPDPIDGDAQVARNPAIRHAALSERVYLRLTFRELDGHRHTSSVL
jgi:hypothetical protein